MEGLLTAVVVLLGVGALVAGLVVAGRGITRDHRSSRARDAAFLDSHPGAWSDE